MRHRGPIAPSIFKRHPLTGELIEPVGVLDNGKCIWPIMGGAEDDDDDDDDKKDGDDSGDAGKSDDKSKDGDSGADKGDAISKEDYDAIERRMRAADKRASEAEAKLKEVADKDKDELTKATERASELEKQNEALQSEVKRLRLNNAFLTANTHDWHDPEVALDLAQAKGFIEDDIIDEEGKVDKKRLKKSLDRLASEKPFLVQTSKKKDDDDGDDDDKDKSSSGEPAGSRSDNTKDERARKAKLRGRFPALNQGV